MLSGFSNSSGGVVIWGVDSRKNERGVDCASGVRLIHDLPLFLARLNELTGSSVSPIVDGVLHRSLTNPENENIGFAATYVPESDSGPHMAKLGEDRYYKRSGDSFYRLEHFDLEDMFGRRKRPNLMLSHRVTQGQNETIVFLGIRNVGRGTAVAPYLAFNIPEPFTLRAYGIDGNRNEGLPRLHHAGMELSHRYGSNSTFVIHPGVVHEVAAITFDPRGQWQEVPDCIQIEYEVTSENIALKRYVHTVNFNE